MVARDADDKDGRGAKDEEDWGVTRGEEGRERGVGREGAAD